MKKCELLSPAGNMEMLKYAVAYGADAVYLAGTKFGARKYANNFTDEELSEAVKYAHLRGVKVYITINTLIYEDEVKSFVENVKFIHRLGVDAVLVQDFGMMNLIKKIAPNLEIHASTQFHTGSNGTLKLLESIGIKRAVLDRELALCEIRGLDTTLELEVFIHGALCVSYSGQCLFSSLVLERSGNRGECAGLCRLPYRRKTEDGSSSIRYYLSLRDLCAGEEIYALIGAGVNSLKIEGRMKSPEYVGYMTKMYRNAIDSYYANERRKFSEEEKTNMSILFNRGLTDGFLKGTFGKEMCNLESPNHVGVRLGHYEVRKKRIALMLEMHLEQGDIIRFKEEARGMTVNFLYDERGKLVNGGNSGTTVYVDNFLNLSKGGELRLVGKASLNKEIQDLPRRTVPIWFKFEAMEGKPIELTVKEGRYEVRVNGECPLLAKNRAVSEEDVRKQLAKTGNTVYVVDRMDVLLGENLFINLKDLNVLRREALSRLDDVRLKREEPVFFEQKEVEVQSSPCRKSKLLVVVATEEQYKVAVSYADKIFSSNEELYRRHSDIFPRYVDARQDIEARCCIIGDYGLLTKIDPAVEVYGDYMLNVTNSVTARALMDRNVRGVLISLELKKPKIEQMVGKVDMSHLGVFVYGHVELMKMKYDPLEGKTGALVDRNGSSYSIIRDNFYKYLMSSKPINRLDEIGDYINLGCGFFRMDFTTESAEKCAKLLEKFHTIK